MPRCPVGPAVGINAYEDGELVGHIAGTPFRAELAGREERGLNLHHAVTDPSHGGRGIFKAFVRAVLEAGAADGYGFVVGLPNANSTFGVVERIGFQLVRPLVREARHRRDARAGRSRAARLRAALERRGARLATRAARRALPRAAPRRARQRVRAGRVSRRRRRAGHVPLDLDTRHVGGVALRPARCAYGRASIRRGAGRASPIWISRAAGCRLPSTSCSSI